MTAWSELVATARGLVGPRRRALLGITGVPGAGKTTLATRLVAALNAERPGFAVHVPMDGYHLADGVLTAHGTLHRKGAPDTFDGWGYLTMMQLLGSAPDHPVYAPQFERGLEQPLAGAIEVPPQARLVVSEGNYLLVDALPWSRLPQVLDSVWFCEADESRRRQHLRDRHVAFGKTPELAAAWVEAVDEPNARLVAATRGRADRVLETY
jgi:pantothenate kinase